MYDKHTKYFKPATTWIAGSPVVWRTGTQDPHVSRFYLTFFTIPFFYYLDT